jgi:PiT family inorganic phosphate transporter
MWQILSGVFLGWSLGSNDASNVFGTAVASRMVKFWTAAVLCSVFVILGAMLEGGAGMETYSQLLSNQSSPNLAFAVGLSAAITVTMMSYLALPVSTSQAVVGAMVLVGVMESTLDTGSLGKVVLCWVGTPIGAAAITVVLYFVLGKLINRANLTIFTYDRYLRWGLIAGGSYGAYALGANNVANVTGPFVGEGMLSVTEACAVGSAAIALGVVTYSRKVMMTVGRDLVRLDAFTALVAILAEAITVHMYAIIGVPVSTSQAIVGAVLGIGLVKGVRTIQMKTLAKILFGWIGTPAISAGITWICYQLLKSAGMI